MTSVANQNGPRNAPARARRVTRGRLRRTLLLGSLLACAAAPGSLDAQAGGRLAIEAGGGVLASSNPTTERGSVLDGRLLLRLDAPEWLSIGVGATQLWSASERDGLVCHRLQPTPMGCAPERLEESVTLRSYRVGAYPETDLGSTLRGRVGLGISMNVLSGTSQGVTTGGQGNLHMVPWGHIGAFAELALLWAPFPDTPLDVVLGGGGNGIWFDACRDHVELFTPYCRVTPLAELRAGLAYRFGLP